VSQIGLSLAFCLKNAADREVKQIQNRQIWRPILRIQNSANSRWVVLVVLNLLNDIFSISICHLAPGDHILSQKVLVDVSVDTFASKNQPSAC
jgi:hypothetical protein